MTLAWSAALLAQAALAMRLPPGALRQFHLAQVAAGLLLLPIYGTSAYRHAYIAAMILDGWLLIRASGRIWNPAIAASVALLPLAIGAGSAVHFGRALMTWYAFRYALALLPTAYAISAASGWLMAFAWIRYLFMVAGWWAWFTSPALLEAKGWALALFFAAWAINAKRPAEASR